MAWEWSHSPEAYDAACRNVQDLPKDTLLTILSEWQYHDMEQAQESADSDAYDLNEEPKALPLPSFDLPGHIKALTEDVLADSVWERMSELATCDNGGFNAWCCPDGCHTVPFDRENAS